MSTQNPDPYGIEGRAAATPGTGPVESITTQVEVDDRARSTRLDAVALEPGRKCVGCGYDLAGLFVGGNCPECGDKILSLMPSGDTDALRRTPDWYLRLLGVLFAVMCVCVLAHLALYGLGILSFSRSFSLVSSGPMLAALQVIVLVWFACVVAICLPPPELERVVGIGRSRPDMLLSLAAIVTQSGVVISAFHPILTGRVIDALVTWPWILSFYGMALVSVQMAKVAFRLNDEDRYHRLQTAGVAIVLGAGMVWLFGAIIGAHVPSLSLFGALFLILQIIGLAMAVWGLLYLSWSCWCLSREAGWAIRNKKAAAGRVIRLKERARADYEQAQRERAASEPFGGPMP